MSFKLSAITLDNLNQVNVTQSESNKVRSSGRRFSVSVGKDSKDVVLKELFSKAKNLAKTATTSSEVKKVNGFIAQLIEVEADATLTYNGRNDTACKIKTWFHRLFGEGGNHLDRLNALKSNVDAKYENVKEIALLSSFTLLETLLKNKKIDNRTINLAEQEYIITCLPSKLTVGSLAIDLDPNRNEGRFEFEGAVYSSISEQFKPLYDAVIQETYKASSSY